MFRNITLLTIICLGGSGLAVFFCPSIAYGTNLLSLSSGIVADPGQAGVPIYLVLTSSSPIAGVDMFLDYEQDILIYSSIEFLTRFQYVSYDVTPQGKITIVLRRQNPDSTYLPPLPAGTDTLGILRMNVTSQDLLWDVETLVRFFENPFTPHPDNRLVKSDSSFILPRELTLRDGAVFIRHPLYGDVNDDEYVNTIADVIFFVNFLAGSQNLSSRQRANSDVNRDGLQASMADFVELIRRIVEE